MTAHYCGRIPPFGHLRISGYVLLPAAFRSLSRPSSAPSAKASALCPSLLDLSLVFCLPRFVSLLRFSAHVLKYAPLLAQSVPREENKILRDSLKSLLFTLSENLLVLFLTLEIKDLYPSLSLSLSLILSSVVKVHGGLGRTRTSDLTLIRRAL